MAGMSLCYLQGPAGHAGPSDAAGRASCSHRQLAHACRAPDWVAGIGLLDVGFPRPSGPIWRSWSSSGHAQSASACVMLGCESGMGQLLANIWQVEVCEAGLASPDTQQAPEWPECASAACIQARTDDGSCMLAACIEASDTPSPHTTSSRGLPAGMQCVGACSGSCSAGQRA